MEEKLTDLTVDLLLEGIGKKINQKKENFEWQELFLKTGTFFINDGFEASGRLLCILCRHVPHGGTALFANSLFLRL